MRNEKKPKVSVIMPVYNQERFIAEAIQSILDQTFQDFEIIITNDGSTDNTWELINNFSDPRIKLLNFEKNKGISNALNNCIANSRGEYIALLNSDDAFLSDKLKRQVDFLEKNKNIAAVFTLANIIDEKGQLFKDKNHFYYSIFDQPNRTRFEWLNQFFYNGNCLCHPSMMARKQCLDDVGYYDSRFHQMQDFELYVRICLKHNIHIIQEKLVNFRVLDNEANVSGNRPDSRNRSAWEMEKILEDFLKIRIEDFENAFPKSINFKKPLEKELLSFYVALLASKITRPEYAHFALQTLYDLVGNKNILEKMQSLEDFNSQSFVRLAGELDVFQINSLENLNIELKKYQQDIQQKEDELSNIANSLRWKIPNYFYKIYRKLKSKIST